MAECRRLFPNQQLVVLWLGSSIGNLSPAEAVQFFQDMTASAGTNIQVGAELASRRILLWRESLYNDALPLCSKVPVWRLSIYMRPMRHVCVVYMHPTPWCHGNELL